MKNKFLAFLVAFAFVFNACTGSVFAENATEETTEAWSTAPDEVTTETITETTTSEQEPNEEIVPDDTISADEFYSQSENLQGQIDEIRQMFEENGYSLDGLNGDMEGISAEIDGLQMSLEDLYSLINTVQAQQSKAVDTPQSVNEQNQPTAVQTTAPITTTTITTTTTVAADTTPNGYLVEKAEKYPEERDFITVTTRDGHVFYLVIDYESDDKRVYFLNTVDTEDLKRILETGTSNSGNNTDKPKESETQTVSSENITTAKTETATPQKSNMMIYIIGGIGVAVFVFLAKKKLSGKKNKYDDEADSDDFTEEQPEEYVNEDTEEKDENE